jgi:hypothetical protein
MTETLYPHESPMLLLFSGLVFLIISGIITTGNIIGWFLPPPPLLTPGIWCTTMINLEPSLLGMNPIYISATFAIIGVIFICVGLYYFKTNEPINNEYCPYCKRRL